MKNDTMKVKRCGGEWRKMLLCSSLDHCYSLRVASGIYIELPSFVVPVKKKREKKKGYILRIYCFPRK